MAKPRRHRAPTSATQPPLSPPPSPPMVVAQFGITSASAASPALRAGLGGLNLDLAAAVHRLLHRQDRHVGAGVLLRWQHPRHDPTYKFDADRTIGDTLVAATAASLDFGSLVGAVTMSGTWWGASTPVNWDGPSAPPARGLGRFRGWAAATA